MNGDPTTGREPTHEEQAHEPIHKELDNLRARVVALESQIRELQAGHGIDSPKVPTSGKGY